MNLAERLARASHNFFKDMYGLPDYDALPDADKSASLQLGRALAADIRLPSPAMDDAGKALCEIPGPVNCITLFGTMIDAGLAEP